MARKRGLTEEDARLWNRIAAGTNRLAGRPLAPESPPESPEATPRPAPKVPDPLPVSDMPGNGWLIEPFRLGAKAGASGRVPRPVPPLAQQLHDAPIRMDPHTHRRLRKGKLVPEARIDLHGMTLAVAMPALTLFILRAQASGQRLVLVITGKGRGGPGDPGPLPTRPGALRHAVPHWLHMPPLSAAAAQVLPAHDRHGGGGAYYVWLRKGR